MSEQLKKYYFTFGIDSNEQPYKGGWVTVIAQNIDEAVKKFTGNYGVFEHELIK